MQFSPSTGCFYPDDISYPDGSIPTDAVEATSDDFAAWCNATSGSTITIADGHLTINPPPAPTLDALKGAKVGALNGVYQAAVIAPVAFTTAAGAKAMFSREASAKAMADLAVEQGASAWTANVWIDAAHAPVAPFTFADIQALQAALAAPTSPSLSNLMAKVAAVNAATDAKGVAAISF